MSDGPAAGPRQPAEGRPLSAQSTTMLEVGKTMVTSSLTVPSNYCSSMISIALGAIPTYIALLTYFSTKVPASTVPPLWALLLPPSFLLLAAAAFIIGYVPIRQKIDLADIGDIETKYDRVVLRRWRCSVLGTAVLFLAIILAIAILIEPALY